MICTYCHTDQPEQRKHCFICQADLEQDRPQIKPYVNEEEAYQPQPVLATYHTYDLLVLLRFLRKQRTDNYKLMQTVRKAPEEAKNSNYNELNEYGQQLYRELTARKNVIEQILIDRMGYYPKRIDNNLLNTLKDKIGMIQSYSRKNS